MRERPDLLRARVLHRTGGSPRLVRRLPIERTEVALQNLLELLGVRVRDLAVVHDNQVVQIGAHTRIREVR